MPHGAIGDRPSARIGARASLIPCICVAYAICEAECGESRSNARCLITTVRSRRLETVGFYERMSWGERTGLGSYITREDIERRRPLRVTHMLGDVPGVHLSCSGLSCTVRMVRSVDCGNPNVYLDNVLINRCGGRVSPDSFVMSDDVAGIEVYRGPSELPGEYAGADARCGAIVIWTRSAP